MCSCAGADCLHCSMFGHGECRPTLQGTASAETGDEPSIRGSGGTVVSKRSLLAEGSSLIKKDTSSATSDKTVNQIP